MTWLAEHTLRISGISADLQRSGDVVRIITISAKQSNGGSARVSLLTFNVIAMSILFSLGRWDLRRAKRSGVALALLVLTHAMALYVTIRATLLATIVGQGANVSSSSWNFWFALSQGYAVVGGYAIVFLLWWLFGREAAE